MDLDLWNISLEELYEKLGSRTQGLTSQEVLSHRREAGFNRLFSKQHNKGIRLFLSQFKSPLIWILTAAALVSSFLKESSDALIIFMIVLTSGTISFFQERGALNSLEKILKLVAVRIRTWRDGTVVPIDVEEVVPGDIVELSAGDQVPGDCMIIESKNLLVNESKLTGESRPIEKARADIREIPLLKRTDLLFMSSNVVGGYARVLVVATGWNTQFGAIAKHVRFRPPETAFEAGVRKFGFFLMIVTLVLISSILLFNIYFDRPFFEALLFSVALAVGLTPQLLPVIISVNLSHGARKMAAKKVVVKRLPSIENFGQMDVLCCDKTGTITMGTEELHAALDARGENSPQVARLSALNAHFQQGYPNPLDQAILRSLPVEEGWEKLDEQPYDFERKRMVVLLRRKEQSWAIAKGAVQSIVSMCKKVELSDGSIVSLEEERERLMKFYEDASSQGYRHLAVAYAVQESLALEGDFVFAGFLQFFDPLKPDVIKTVHDLHTRGVQLKIITGDSAQVASHIGKQVGFSPLNLMKGEELAQISDEALCAAVNEKNIFAEIEPNQKEKIILALRKNGHIVGFLGDGVNDLSALHSADVSIAVEGGADAAKEAADIVLLKKDLTVLHSGVDEGRRTFANTLKYVYMATSANFGNMFSMAGASIFLPFLPLLPKQILLVNFLTDFPEMMIASDRVDSELVNQPLRWNLPLIRRFMIIFGLISSIFDFLTFGVLFFWIHASMDAFRTGWLIESVASAALVTLCLRTHRPLFRSYPARKLALTIVGSVCFVALLPLTFLGQEIFGLVSMPFVLYGAVAGIVALYLVSVEIAKKFFFGFRS